MTLTDMVGSIQQIQAQLAQLSAVAAPTASPATSAASATSFASALDSASSGAPVRSTTASTDGTTIDAGVTGEDVLAAAKQYEGVPYVFGGESRSGMDCSGLVQKAFADLGVSVPRTSQEQATVGQKVGSLKDAKPGDLIVLNGGDHIAIYAGNDQVLQAPYAGRTVGVEKIWFTDKDVTSIRRVVPSTGADAASVSSTQAAALAQLSDVLGGSTGSGSSGLSLSSLMSSLGTSGASSGTASQLLAARAALAGASS
ncbi:C40 family peptidase [Amnibacterium sp. CER49]|uniref:C40 family peptidase n=1 Tax=Amnibacterium sp. CER49 TaxID=3039161 RepID=UPI00244CAA2F|nr:C40 family peptidase [Amnibacterium sp. CER49]MDH2443859.1 C40 family peptidase [Amnibacterium sp. CER49]